MDHMNTPESFPESPTEPLLRGRVPKPWTAMPLLQLDPCRFLAGMDSERVDAERRWRDSYAR